MVLIVAEVDLRNRIASIFLLYLKQWGRGFSSGWLLPASLGTVVLGCDFLLPLCLALKKELVLSLITTAKQRPDIPECSRITEEKVQRIIYESCPDPVGPSCPSPSCLFLATCFQGTRGSWTTPIRTFQILPHL